MGAKGGLAAKEISTVKKKLITYYRDKKKDAMREFQPLTKPHPFQIQGLL